MSIKDTCHVLSDLVEAASSEGTKPRKIMFNSIQEYIDIFSHVLTAYITDTGIYWSLNKDVFFYNIIS